MTTQLRDESNNRYLMNNKNIIIEINGLPTSGQCNLISTEYFTEKIRELRTELKEVHRENKRLVSKANKITDDIFEVQTKLLKERETSRKRFSEGYKSGLEQAK